MRILPHRLDDLVSTNACDACEAPLTLSPPLIRRELPWSYVTCHRATCKTWCVTGETQHAVHRSTAIRVTRAFSRVRSAGFAPNLLVCSQSSVLFSVLLISNFWFLFLLFTAPSLCLSSCPQSLPHISDASPSDPTGLHLIRCYLHPLIYWYIGGIQTFYVEAT